MFHVGDVVAKKDAPFVMRRVEWVSNSGDTTVLDGDAHTTMGDTLIWYPSNFYAYTKAADKYAMMAGGTTTAKHPVTIKRVGNPLPDDDKERKEFPLYSGLFAYFPSALAAVSHRSFEGNEKHNPGQPLHWARGKSKDHKDAALRHLLEDDLVGAAWRILAALQIKLEDGGHKKAPGARG